MKKQTFPYLLLVLVISMLALAACGGSSAAQSSAPSESDAGSTQAEAAAGDPAAGRAIFAGTCSACHGPNGEGVTGLGKDMTTSEFIAGKTDQELVEFIKVGRDPSDPLNTTGVAMPPKGGNPALSDEDLLNVASYVRSLQP